MKRLICIMLCAMVLLCAAGCMRDDRTPNNNNNANTNTGTQKPTGQQQDSKPDEKEPAVPPSLGTTDDDLTADSLLGMIGKTEGDLRDLLGAEAAGDAAGTANYKSRFYGADARVRYDRTSDGRIDKVIVTVDEKAAEKWKTDLIERYGEAKDDVWSKDDYRIRRAGSGSEITYTFGKESA